MASSSDYSLAFLVCSADYSLAFLACSADYSLSFWHVAPTILQRFQHFWHVAPTILQHFWHVAPTILQHFWHVAPTFHLHFWHVALTILLHFWHVAPTITFSSSTQNFWDGVVEPTMPKYPCACLPTARYLEKCFLVANATLFGYLIVNSDIGTVLRLMRCR